jgi:hypothetical protein
VARELLDKEVLDDVRFEALLEEPAGDGTGA